MTETVHTLPVEEFMGRFAPCEYERSGAGWDEVADHPNFLAANPFNPDRIHAGTWDEFVFDVARHGIREPIEVDPDEGRVCEGHHRVVAAMLTGVPVPFFLGG